MTPKSESKSPGNGPAEHLNGVQGVRGSNPPTPTILLPDT